MLLGLAVGAGVTMLLRRPPARHGLGSRAKEVRRSAMKAGRRGARWAREQAEDGLDWGEETTDQIANYLASARDAINDAVADELKGLKKSVRRRRRKLGL